MENDIEKLWGPPRLEKRVDGLKEGFRARGDLLALGRVFDMVYRSMLALDTPTLLKMVLAS